MTCGAIVEKQGMRVYPLLNMCVMVFMCWIEKGGGVVCLFSVRFLRVCVFVPVQYQSAGGHILRSTTCYGDKGI